MRVFLAGVISHKYYDQVPESFVLESYEYIKEQHEPYLSKARDLIIDSGAFTYMQKLDNKHLDFTDFIDDYIEFIKRNNITKFMEFDLDRVKGIGWVEDVRRYLEKKTNRPSIPVWHKTRGIDYFKRLCRDYDYIAIGGIGTTAADEIHPPDYPKLKPLVDYAHKCNCKVHGLGFTVQKYLPIVHFDSVDSKSWLGTCWGKMFRFNNLQGVMQSVPHKGLRIKDHRALEQLNLKEWIKYQRYAEVKF